jgi:outer membrane protein insertion porin family
MKADLRRLRALAVLFIALSVLWPGGTAAVAEELPVTATFEGNEAYDDDRLRESVTAELERVKEGKDWRMSVDDAAFQMESAYHEDGYAFAVVDYDLGEVPGERKVVFRIEEGPRVLLGNLKFIGNEFFPHKDLEVFFGRGGEEGLSEKVLSVVKLGSGKEEAEEIPYVEGMVKDAVGSIEDLYYVNGFTASKVSEPEIAFSSDRARADVTVKIEEGPQHFVRSVTFSGDLRPETEEDLEKLDTGLEGKTYQASRRTALRTRTGEIYRIKGYPDVKVDITEGRGDQPGDVTLEAVIESGPRVRVTGFDVEGNRKTRESFIRKRIIMEPGDWYDLQKERRSFLNLNRTGIFKTVAGTLEGEEGAEERRMMIRVAEKPSRKAIFDLGWGSYEKARGAVGFTEKNFFGTGREVGAAVGGSLKGWYIRGLASDPWFLGTDIRLSAPLDYSLREQPSYTEKKLEAAAVLTKKLSKHISGSVRYSYKLSDTTDIDTEEPDPDFQEDYNMGALRLRFTRDTRNDFFYPSKGKRGSISFEVADPVLGGDVSFFRFTFTSSAFFALTKSTVVALRWDTGFLYPTSERTVVPIPERFFNGGENNVRSYREDQLGPKDLEGDPTGGLAANVFTIELRQRLAGNIAGSLFVDAGNVVPNKTRIEQGLPPYTSISELLEDVSGQYFSEFHYAVGAGFQYLLPVGPLRLDVALNPDPQVGEEKWTIHFSLGMSF